MLWAMNPTSKVMRTEVSRLRSLADRLEAFAAELDGEPANKLEQKTAPKTAANGSDYSKLTQTSAIIKALRDHGPQTTQELFVRLNEGGKPIAKRTYVTALMPRLK